MDIKEIKRRFDLLCKAKTMKDILYCLNLLRN